MQSIIVEVAMFKLNEGVTDQAFISEAAKVQESFLKNQKGYLDRELLKDENGQWFDILHWASMEEAQTAAQVMMQEAECQPFVQMINPQSIQMFHLVRQKEWGLL
jgi:heme-degrading monooxygenase HmoA